MIESLAVALMGTLLSALAIYAFRKRQLYLVIPRLFASSPLSAKGKLAELRVFNKGRIAELEVRITLDPAASYEIIASTDNTCSLTNATVEVPRIPPGDDFSVLVLSEGGDLTKDHVSGISSATTKGKVINELGEVPPNAGNALLGALAFILLIAAPIASIEGYSTWQEHELDKRVERIKASTDQNWNGLQRYAESQFSELYALGEFPIYLSDLRRDGQRVFVTFKVMNRAAAPLDLTLTTGSPFKEEDPEPWKSLGYESAKVAPSGTDELTTSLYWPSGRNGTAEFEFNMSVGQEDFLKATTEINVDV